MGKYDCVDCINLSSSICEYCSVTKMPSGVEMRPRYFVRISSIGRVIDGGIPQYIQGCVERGKTIPLSVIEKYNRTVEEKSK